MAYNREWDQGKDYWNEAAWNGSDTKAHVRQREEDYHGEGKRRKFNNGVRLPTPHTSSDSNEFQEYDVSQSHDDGGHDRGHAQDYGQEERPQRPGFAIKKRLTPSEPSPHVIFLGLDPDFTEADVCRFFWSLLHRLRGDVL
jgi:RNA-binding protein 5/10